MGVIGRQPTPPTNVYIGRATRVTRGIAVSFSVSALSGADGAARKHEMGVDGAARDHEMGVNSRLIMSHHGICAVITELSSVVW